jgi:hypothetical protein
MGAFSEASAAASGFPPGAVRVVALPSVRLHTPHDGRVNGDGFTAQVTGYRFGRQFGPASSAVQAPPGQRLLTFGLIASTHALTASLEVDGHGERLQLPRNTPASVPVYYLASLPARAKQVVLELSRDGYTQGFSFTSGERVGPQPAVLYDSMTSWQVSRSFTGEVSLSVLGPPSGAQLSAHQVMLLSTTLTYFLPSTGATPGRPSEAWLVVKGTTFPFYTAASRGLPHLAYARALRAGEVTLALPDRKPVAAKSLRDGRTAKGDLFGGYYYWSVPASTQAATLNITLPPLVATDPVSGARLKFRAKLSATPVSLDFPAPEQPTPPLAGNPAPYLRSHLSGPSSAPASSSGWALAVVALGVVAAAGTGLVLVAVRRRARAGQVRGVAVLGASGQRGQAAPSKGAADVNAGLGVAGPDEGRRVAEAGTGTGVDAPRPSPAGGSATVIEVPSVPLEGALFHMVGEVRLVPSPSPARTPAESVPSSSAIKDGPSAAPSPVATGAGGPSGDGRETSLVPVPTGLPALAEGAKEVQVLGPPRLVCEPGGVVALGLPELELLARMALEPGRVFGSDELRADIGSAKDTDWAPSTLWTRVSAVRKAVGGQHVPPSSKAGGYKVVGIGTDVARFEAATARAKAAPGAAAVHLAEALSLVRGAPFAGVPGGSFGWALDAGGLATRVANEVYDAAVALARLAVAAGDATLADWAIARGRLVSRDDDLLDELALDAAAVSSARSSLARAWASTKRRYRAAGKKLPGTLVEHYRQLQGRTGPDS